MGISKHVTSVKADWISHMSVKGGEITCTNIPRDRSISSLI